MDIRKERTKEGKKVINKGRGDNVGQPIYTNITRENGDIYSVVSGEDRTRIITEQQLRVYIDYLESEITRVTNKVSEGGGTPGAWKILKDYPVYLEQARNT